MASLTEEQRLNLQKNLKELNNKLHYTVAYVAEHSGVSKSALENYLANRKGAKPEMLQKLANFYHTTVDALISSDMVGTDIAIQKAVREAATPVKRTTDFERITQIIDSLCPQGKMFSLLIGLIQRFGYNVTYEIHFSQEEVDAYSSAYGNLGTSKETIYEKQFDERSASHKYEASDNATADRMKQIQEFMASKKDLIASLKFPSVEQKLNHELFIAKYNNGDFDGVDVCDLPIEIRLQQYDNPEAVHTATDIADLDYYNEDYPISKFMELLDQNLEDFIMGFLEDEKI